MVAMLWTAAHKTVVISARSQEQGELVPEYRTEQTGEMQLPCRRIKSRQADLYTTGIGDESGECNGGEPLHGEGTLDLHRKRKKSIL